MSGYAQMIDILRETMTMTAIRGSAVTVAGRDYCVTRITQIRHTGPRQLLETCVSWGYDARTMIFHYGFTLNYTNAYSRAIDTNRYQL